MQTRTRLVRTAVGAGALTVLILALTALRRELHHVHYHEVAAAMRALPFSLLLLAALMTAASYVANGLSDGLGLRFAGRPKPWRTSGLVGFLATAFSNTAGFPLLSGGSIRYRFYSAAGLQATDTAKVVGFVSSTFWLGFFTLGGLFLTVMPPAIPAAAPAVLQAPRVLGLLLLLPPAAYAALVLARSRPLELGGLAVPLPRPRLALAQILVAWADWLMAAGALAVLLRGSGLPVAEVLGVFLFAQIVGLVSHVPGGLGVFESVFLLFFVGRAPAAAILGALLAFRVIYYLLPFAAATTTLVAIELARRRHALSGALATLSRWAGPFVPSLLAAATFLAGTLLLASGATPTPRAHAASHLLGLGVVETSHLAASVVGLLLLLLARGLQRRLDGAYVLALGLLLAGSALSLLKGLDWEEALVLAGVALALAPFRSAFYRRASLLAERFSAAWLTAVGCVLAGTTWLGFFAHQRVAYSNDLWWRFAAQGDASRFLRATVAVAVVALLLGLGRLLAAARPSGPAPSPADVAAVQAVVERSPDTAAHLALIGDKAFLFNDARDAFVMYAPAGKCLVAMGDPVGGAPAERRELAWRFHDLADRHGVYTVFYQVSADSLPLYLDLGLQLLKLGEEARVDLAAFSLDGREHRSLRGSFNRVHREGLRFEVVDPPAVPALLPRLQDVSDRWLAQKNTREKSFSLGAFDPRYLAACPVALLWKEDRLLAFANLWRGAGGSELSVDLMRHLPDAPGGTMEYLFLRLMAWGRAQGFATFNLGMAPLSGFEQSPRLPTWGKLASLLYRHGEHFYNFQGIRAYKEKFRPSWHPKYLASPGGLALPVVLASVASLVSGGLIGAVTKAGRRRPAVAPLPAPERAPHEALPSPG